MRLLNLPHRNSGSSSGVSSWLFRHLDLLLCVSKLVAPTHHNLQVAITVPREQSASPQLCIAAPASASPRLSHKLLLCRRRLPTEKKKCSNSFYCLFIWIGLRYHGSAVASRGGIQAWHLNPGGMLAPATASVIWALLCTKHKSRPLFQGKKFEEIFLSLGPPGVDPCAHDAPRPLLALVRRLCLGPPSWGFFSLPEDMHVRIWVDLCGTDDGPPSACSSKSLRGSTPRSLFTARLQVRSPTRHVRRSRPVVASVRCHATLTGSLLHVSVSHFSLSLSAQASPRLPYTAAILDEPWVLSP